MNHSPVYILSLSLLLASCGPAPENPIKLPTIQDSLEQDKNENDTDENDAVDENVDAGGGVNVEEIIQPGKETETETDTSTEIDTEVQSLQLVEGKWYALRTQYNLNLCLTATLTQTMVAGCQDNNEQLWTMDDQHRLLNGQSSSDNQFSCLERVDQSLQLNACHSGQSQIWGIKRQAIVFESLALDVNRSNKAVITYPAHYYENQLWQAIEKTRLEDRAEPEENDTDLIADVKLEPCPDGSEIYTSTPNAGVARMGSVFSKTLYNPNDQTSSNNSHQPQPLRIQVTNGGKPVENCQVEWLPDVNTAQPAANGWVFAEQTHTDANGEIIAWWTAGDGYTQTVSAHIRLQDGSHQQVSMSGQAYPHSTRSNSIHINWSSEEWDYFSVDVTPLTLPATTYYSAINFPGGYAGLQTNKYLFSVWDVNGVDAQVVDPGIATCTGFGGEGTGAKCYVDYEPNMNTTYRFEVQVSYPQLNSTDYTLFFTDLSNNQRTRVAQLRYGKRELPRGAAGFVEDWWEKGSSCLETNERSAYFGRVLYKKGVQPITEIKQARATAVYNEWHNEVCSNYFFGSENGQFLWSSGGKRKVSPPHNIDSNAFSNVIELKP